MGFLAKIIFSKTLGVTTAVLVFGCCKADGG
jgi:hypothetical protein